MTKNALLKLVIQFKKGKRMTSQGNYTADELRDIYCLEEVDRVSNDAQTTGCVNPRKYDTRLMPHLPPGRSGGAQDIRRNTQEYASVGNLAFARLKSSLPAGKSTAGCFFIFKSKGFV